MFIVEFKHQNRMVLMLFFALQQNETEQIRTS